MRTHIIFSLPSPPPPDPMEPLKVRYIGSLVDWFAKHTDDDAIRARIERLLGIETADLSPPQADTCSASGMTGNHYTDASAKDRLRAEGGE